MDRDRAVDEALRLIADHDAGRAVDLVADWRATGDDPLAGPLAAFALFMAGRQEDARSVALLAATDPIAVSDPPDGDLTRAGTAAILALIACTLDEAAVGDPFATLADQVGAVPVDERWGAFVRYLAIEAALAAARLDLAFALRPDGPAAFEVWEGHPYAGVMLACEVRLAVFGGRIDEAQALIGLVTPTGLAGNILKATGALVAGNAVDVPTMRRLVAEVTADRVEPREYLGRGVHLLLAFAVIALSDTTSAARHVLDAGGDADLSGLAVVDRALAYELLVAAAVDEGDLDAAGSWLARATTLGSHRAAAPCVERMRARVALLASDAPAAVVHAERAVVLARADGRTVEASEGRSCSPGPGSRPAKFLERPGDSARPSAAAT